MFQSSPALYQRGRLELRIVNAGRFVSILARALSTRAHSDRMPLHCSRNVSILARALSTRAPQRADHHEAEHVVSILARALSTRAPIAHFLWSPFLSFNPRPRFINAGATRLERVEQYLQSFNPRPRFINAGADPE